MARKFFTIGITLILLLVFVTPAGAISYGESDNGDHPEVGAIVIRIPGEGTFEICSGTLISDTVFLTASHCIPPLDYYDEIYPGSTIGVVFDQTIADDSYIYTGVWHINPAYLSAHGSDDPGDVAVIVLDVAPGITPASLPTAGLLDELKADHTLNGTNFTAVGYGTVRTTNHTAFQAFLDNSERNRVDQEFLSLTDAWLTNSMNLATGNGGTCYGDSGGPHFIHLDGEETNIVVSVTVIGDRYCKATDKTYRVDTPAARQFLSKYVPLPEE